MFLELRHSLETARSLVDVISSRADAKDEIVADLVLTNHPIFGAIRKAMGIPYRLLFYDVDELSRWAEARGFSQQEDPFDDTIYEWIKSDSKSGRSYILDVKKEVFDKDGKLIALSSDRWSDNYIAYTVTRPRKLVLSADSSLDDDVPF